MNTELQHSQRNPTSRLHLQG